VGVRNSVPERDKQTGDLARQANKLLVDTDDACSTRSRRSASPRPSSTTATSSPIPTRWTARRRAQAGLHHPPAARRLHSGGSADQGEDVRRHHRPLPGGEREVDDQAKRLDNLRDLEKTAPAALAALRRRSTRCRLDCPRSRRPEDAVGLRAHELGRGQGQRRGSRQAGPLRRNADRRRQGGTGRDAPGLRRRRSRRAGRPGGSGSGQPASRCRRATRRRPGRRAKQDKGRLAAADADIAAAKKALAAAAPNTPLGTTRRTSPRPRIF
jgi:hypothetical protein